MRVQRSLTAVTVTTAGTRVVLSATQKLCYKITVEADKDNTGYIYLGDVTVASTKYIARLGAGDSYTIDIGLTDVNKYYVDSSANSQKVQVSIA